MLLWLTVILILVGIIAFIYLVLLFMDRNQLYSYWNAWIKQESRKQNETDRAFYHISSLQSAWACHHPDIRYLQLSIFLQHEELLKRTRDYFDLMLGCAISEGAQGGIRYFPTLDCRRGRVTSLFDTLKLPSIIQSTCLDFGLLILEPKSKSHVSRAPSQGYYRYHYALSLPQEGNYGLYLKVDEKAHRIKWKEKQGIVWDATRDHYIINESEEYCFLLTADIPRSFSLGYNWINSFLHRNFPPDQEYY